MLQIPVFLKLNLILGSIDFIEAERFSVTFSNVWGIGPGTNATALGLEVIVTRLF